MAQERSFEFTDRALKGLPVPPKPQQLDYFDAKARGLGLRISYGGRKSFFAMYSNSAGKRQRVSLGEYGQAEHGKLSLAEARKRAKAKLGEVAKDRDPAAEVRAVRSAPTVRDLAADFIADRHKAGKKSVDQMEKRIAREILPAFGDHKARDITDDDVEALLDAITERPAPIMANRLQEIISAMWTFGRRTNKRRKFYGLPGNVAEGITPNEETPRKRWLSKDEIRDYWMALDDELSGPTKALRLCVLTAQRQSNVLGMRLDQLALDDRLWIIPETKTDEVYEVPLSTAAVRLIEARITEVEEAEKRRAKRGSRTPEPVTWLFPKKRGDGPAGLTFTGKAHRSACLRAKIKGYTAHDHRRTFGSHCQQMKIPKLIWDGILGHGEAGMAAVYGGFNYADMRLDCMEKWADRIAAALGENVVSLDRSRDKPA